MRAISTVLDVSLCLLLVAASATTLAGVPLQKSGGSNAHSAEATATLVATNTASVSYALGENRTDGNVSTVHDTLAGLLATVAVASSEVDADSEEVALYPETDEFRENATQAVARGLRRSEVPSHVQVVARWKPYAGAAIRGRAVAGSTPPPRADVRAATFTVPSGFPTERADAVTAAHADGYSGVAHVLARGLVAGWFPGNGTALRDDTALRNETAARYRRVAEAYDTSVEDGLSANVSRATDVSQANRNLVRALAADVEPRLRERFDSPQAAARAVSVGRVSITVRTWSA
ncbi:DUF7284 family protein [Halorussus halophilus]|uniref:DUF7284 family protein n=1 Tax=Halorussus halophilus TaxID=2650975 RepID=UPI0013014517|nr:hypothetical protein [Halorussus halophilus]